MNYAQEHVGPVPSGSTSSEEVPKVKKRRLHGSCDACRKKKTKCDSANMPDNYCTNCRLANIACEHKIPRQGKKKKEIHPSNASYIQTLEQRLEKMERLLEQQSGAGNAAVSSSAEKIHDHSSFSNTAQKEPFYPELRYPSPNTPSDDLTRLSTPASDESTDTDDLAHVALTKHLSQLSTTALDERFFGKSSAFMFVKQASAMRSETTGMPLKIHENKFRRPIYWDMRPWEMAYSASPRPSYVYPEEALLQNLVFLYFEKMNSIFPVLHEPTFRAALSVYQHTWDPAFGMTVLLVCAVGSRYTQDPRVNESRDNLGLSSGWLYFSQVQIYRNPLLSMSSIYDLQYFVLCVLYLLGTAVPHASWNILALGMRQVLEKGIHRRKGNKETPSAEEELYRRTFWCLLCLDRLLSSFLGRPCIIQDDDFDVDYPIECDDEYWETDDPKQGFKQPPGKPCKLSSFIQLLKLTDILSITLKTLYSTKKSKVLAGHIGDEWERRVVVELDSSMNNWKHSLPSYLVWDPKISDSGFFHQSAMLHATYYYIQILIHRPFLNKKSMISSSLAMCTTAARSCIHVLDVATTRGFRPTHHILVAAFSSGIVLVLNLWGQSNNGVFNDPAQEKDLQTCINVLKGCERKWHVAGRFCDMLNEVGSLNERQRTVTKRQRDESANGRNGVNIAFREDLKLTTGSFFAPTGLEETNRHLGSSFGNVNKSFALPPPPDPTSIRMDEMGLNDLLLFQMAYMTPVQTGGPAFQDIYPVTSHGSLVNTDQHGNGMVPTGNFVQPTPNLMPSEDANPLWPGIPRSFSVDDWDAFARNMGEGF